VILLLVVMTYMFSITSLGCTSGNDFDPMFMIVPPIASVFANIVVFLDINASSPKSGIVIVMLLLFALTAVTAYIFSVKCPRGWTSDKDFARMSVSRWIALGYWACILVVIYRFAPTAVITYMFSISSASCL
jgi:hypothetical protein